MDTQSVIETLTHVLQDFPQVRYAVLYGSVARGTARRDSDLDLAVAAGARRPLKMDILIDISLACSKAAGREVQVRDLARADGFFLKNVLTDGITVICTAPAVKGELIVRMLDFMEDMAPNIRMIRKTNVARFIAGESHNV